MCCQLTIGSACHIYKYIIQDFIYNSKHRNLSSHNLSFMTTTSKKEQKSSVNLIGWQAHYKGTLLGRLSPKILQSQKLQCLLSMDRAREEGADPGDSTLNVFLGLSIVSQSPVCEIHHLYQFTQA